MSRTLTKKEACEWLGISPSTLQRRTKSGQYTATRIGTGQFAELRYTFTGIGRPELEEIIPDPEPEELEAEDQPVEVLPPQPEPSPIDLKAEADRRFAEDYRAGLVTDSSGNKVDGTNERFPTYGAVPLTGPQEREPKKPQSGCSHMNPALLSDRPDPTGAAPLIPNGGPQTAKKGFTQHGEPLAAGLSQEAYDEMLHSWKRNGGGRSMGEQEMAQRRSKDAVLSAFPKAQRV
jgi:hypothetical protein